VTVNIFLRRRKSSINRQLIFKTTSTKHIIMPKKVKTKTSQTWHVTSKWSDTQAYIEGLSQT